MALALAAVLFLLAGWRALAFWTHEPMLAYANNYHQVRVMKPLGIRPDGPGVPNDIGTEDGPWRYLVRQGAMEVPFYPSSDLAFKWPLQALLGALAPGAQRVDVKVQALCLLAAWLLLVADPTMLRCMIGSAIGRYQGFVQAFWGQLQARQGWPARSLDQALYALPAFAWQGAGRCQPVVARLGRAVDAESRAPAAASPRLDRGRLELGIAVSLAGPAAVHQLCVFSALPGDSYDEIQRHALLCYSLGCLVWAAWAAWLTRLCVSRMRKGISFEN